MLKKGKESRRLGNTMRKGSGEAPRLLLTTFKSNYSFICFEDVSASQSTRGGQRTSFKSSFAASTKWVLENKFRSPDLVGRAFTP